MPTKDDWIFSDRDLALRDRRDKTVEDFSRQKVLQRFAVAIGIGHHDHLVGHLGAVDESLRLEARVGVADRAQPLVQIAARLLESVDRSVGVVGRLAGGSLARQRNDVFRLRGRVLVAVAGGSVGVEGRALVAGSAAEHVAQLEKDHHSRNEEKYRAEVEEFHVFRQSIPCSVISGLPTAVQRLQYLHIERMPQSFKSKACIPI